ncbi:unnamed protein product [Vitrella brassicaformis CCMP3155]|uniref:RNA-editing substrate-binding complex 6 protein domain-containing protein n=1 Tax=Vitrella brassicaformis (strain CCMP3155) TaxID=1169540 RepID=A0A0G4EI27_VITBC|nr:unnamed protein product [Vitrella brassicaformis CCMP3155]|eukprot:CEL96634.1 unnamed protein product [Vitrella brassicaformis CCMP3155]
MSRFNSLKRQLNLCTSSSQLICLIKAAMQLKQCRDEGVMTKRMSAECWDFISMSVWKLAKLQAASHNHNHHSNRNSREDGPGEVVEGMKEEVLHLMKEAIVSTSGAGAAPRDLSLLMWGFAKLQGEPREVLPAAAGAGVFIDGDVYGVLAEASTKAMRAFKAQDIANTLQAVSILQLRDEALVTVALQRALSIMDTFTPQGITTVLSSAAKLQLPPAATLMNSLFDQLGERNSHLVAECDARGLATLLQALAARPTEPCSDRLRLREAMLSRLRVLLTDKGGDGLSSADGALTLWSLATLGWRPADDVLQRLGDLSVKWYTTTSSLLYGGPAPSPRDAATTIWSLAKLDCHHRPAAHAIMSSFVRQPYDYGPQPFSMLVWGVAKLGLRSQDFQAALANVALKHASAQQLSLHQAVLVIWSVAALDHRNSALNKELFAIVRKGFLHLTPQQVANVVWSIARLKAKEEPLLASLAIVLKKNAPAFTLQQLGSLFWALATLKWRDDALFALLCAEAAKQLRSGKSADAQVMSNILGALGELGIRDFDLLGAAVASMGRQPMRMTPPNLANTLVAYARLQHRDEPALTALSDAVLLHGNRGSGSRLSAQQPRGGMYGSPYGLLSDNSSPDSRRDAPSTQEEKPTTPTSTTTTRLPPSFSGQHLASILYSFGNLRYRHEGVLSALADTILDRIDANPSLGYGGADDEWLYLALWGFAMCSYWDHSVIPALFKAVARHSTRLRDKGLLDDSGNTHSRILNQAYQALLAQHRLGGRPPIDLPRDLINLWKRKFVEQRIVVSSFHHSFITRLRGLVTAGQHEGAGWTVQVEHRTEDGLSVDAVLIGPQHRGIAIECNGPSHYLTFHASHAAQDDCVELEHLTFCAASDEEFPHAHRGADTGADGKKGRVRVAVGELARYDAAGSFHHKIMRHDDATGGGVTCATPCLLNGSSAWKRSVLRAGGWDVVAVPSFVSEEESVRMIERAMRGHHTR